MYLNRFLTHSTPEGSSNPTFDYHNYKTSMCQILTIFPVLGVELRTSNILTKFFDTKLNTSPLFDFYVGTKIFLNA